jgi:hypothetical protein
LFIQEESRWDTKPKPQDDKRTIYESTHKLQWWRRMSRLPSRLKIEDTICKRVKMNTTHYIVRVRIHHTQYSLSHCVTSLFALFSIALNDWNAG